MGKNKNTPVIQNNTQAINIDFLITDIHENYLCNIFDMMDSISNMKLSELNSKPHGIQSLRDIIDCSIGACFYPLPDQTIKNFFSLEGSMYPLTVKFIHVINQTENNEVYTVQIFRSLYCI